MEKEFTYKGFVGNGFIALFVVIFIFVIAVSCFFILPALYAFALSFVALFAIGLTGGGIFKLEPNEAKVLVFFGKYVGTYSKAGFYWINPFISKKAVSLRSRNLNPEPIKVNDKSGNPIMIGMVLVWRLKDTYKALFEIDSQSLAILDSGPSNRFNYTILNYSKAFENFVNVQSDAALRQVAGYYAYDNTNNSDEITLRNDSDEINAQLVKTLNDRLAMAGLYVEEARINYLAYAPEIAAVMLRRQQADAIISAREKIVDGAVSMVKIALDKLENEGVVNLDDERKAAMVSNLLVVLCGDQPAQPVVNSGSLY